MLGAIWLAGSPGCQRPVGKLEANPDAAPKVAVASGGTPVVQELDDRVIIVGAGISGLSAALELGRQDERVTVLDMSSVFGGHAVMSQGGVTIVDTPLQREAGIEDSPDLAYQDFLKWGEDADPDWVRYYVDNSRHDIFDWLLELGVRFQKVDTAPGNSVDRFHQPVGRGIGLVTPIYRACLACESVQFLWNQQVTRLVVEEDRVVGVLARDLRTGAEAPLRGRAVILATGGFQSNLEMVREFWPREFRFPQRILVGSGKHSVGLGHRLAEEVGGELARMDHQWNYFTGIPDPRHPGTDRGLSAANMYGILVNVEGRRFANLHQWAKEVMPRMLQQEDASVWFVFDEASRSKFVVSGSDWADFRKVEQWILTNEELVQCADTIAELAERAGLPAENLVETVRRYNELVARGEDEDFGRFGPGRPAFSNSASPALEMPPYYAMRAYPLTRKSMGGVAIDLKCRVLDKSRRPITGLYAVGELTGLAGINGKAALEGTFLGPCIVTGRVAARELLARRNGENGTGEHATAEHGTARAREATRSCVECHDVQGQIQTPRPGYWHFEQVHEVALARAHDCQLCHAELSPYRAESHRSRAESLASTCIFCHVAVESRE